MSIKALSLAERMTRVEREWSRQYQQSGGELMPAWVIETYDDTIIVSEDRTGLYYQVAYSITGEIVTFASRDQWQRVEREYTIKARKGAGGEWELDILGVPFGSESDKDSDGEFFDASTETHDDKFGLPPLVHYHGYDDQGKPAVKPEYIGKTIKRWVTDAGVWFRATLDKTSARAVELWQAAKNGTVRASSGSVPHLTRTDTNGHIREWPVTELSILDTATGKNPANRYAVALPVAKAIYARAGLAWPENDSAPVVTPEAGDTAAVAERRERAAQLRARAYDILLSDKE